MKKLFFKGLVVRTGKLRFQRGVFATAFAVMSLFLLFFVGLGMDLGRIYVSRTELQNSADACALAASKSLSGAGTQLSAAEAWGITAGRLNLIGMQAISPTIVANNQVTFSATLSGTFATKNTLTGPGVANSMKYVKCTLRETNVLSILIKVANLITPASVTPTTVGAMAVASLTPSSTTCAIPLATCKISGFTGTSAPPFGLIVGQWYQGKLPPGNGVTGSYKWINYPGFTNVTDMENMLAGNGTCNVDATTTVNGQNGTIGRLLEAWNEHFGIGKNSPALSTVPDYSGYWYPDTWRDSSGVLRGSAYSDFVSRRAGIQPAAPQALGNPWDGSGWAAATKGDRRIVVSPVVDCSALAGGGGATTTVLGWACQLMLNPLKLVNDDMYLEYRGLASDPGSPCAAFGTPAGGGVGAGPLVPTLIQ